MRLIDLLRGFEFCSEYDKVCKHSHITGITADSRKVGPGFLFAALPGGNLSGLNSGCTKQRGRGNNGATN